jgi:outer membrane protein assembly factor BamB
MDRHFGREVVAATRKLKGACASRKCRARAARVACGKRVTAWALAVATPVVAPIPPRGGPDQCAAAPTPRRAVVKLPPLGPVVWPQYRFDRANRGDISATPAQIGAWRVATSDRVQSTPSVIAGRVIAGTHGTGDLYAVDLATGRCLWRVHLPNWIHSDAVGDAETIYVGFGNRHTIEVPGEHRWVEGQGANGVAAIAVESGEVRWVHPTLGAHMPSPTLVDGRLILAPAEGAISAVDPRTGRLLWTRREHLRVAMASAKADAGTIFLGGDPSTVVAVRARDGTRLWRTSLPGFALATGTVTVAVDDSLVYTSAMRTAHTRDLMRLGYGRAAFHRVLAWLRIEPMQDVLFEHRAFALDRATGRIRWSAPLGFGPPVSDNASGSPVLFEDAAIFTSPASQAIWSLSRRTGTFRWRYDVAAMVKGIVSIARGRVYVGDFSGFVHEIDARTGASLRRACFGGGFGPGGFTHIGDMVLFGARDGDLFALPADDLFVASTLRPARERRCGPPPPDHS